MASNSIDGAREASTARHRDAVRVLQILSHAGKRVTGNASRHLGVVAVLKAAKALNALEFWMRYPDYLVNELLTMYEEDPVKHAHLLDEAIKAFDGVEPELRRLGMLRNWFGAYDALDDALSTLVYLGLVRHERKIHTDGVRVKERSYHLLQTGDDLAKELAKIEPLSWYAERARLVAIVARGQTGNQLKERQHEIAQYHNARHGDVIEPIMDIVAARLATVRARAGR